MEIEVHQRGGLLGLNRRYLVKDGQVKVFDDGRSQRSRSLDPAQADRIDRLAQSASKAEVEGADSLASDSMETKVDIRGDGGSSSLKLRSGDKAPRAVWDLIGEVSKASGA